MEESPDLMRRSTVGIIPNIFVYGAKSVEAILDFDGPTMIHYHVFFGMLILG